MTIVPFGKYKGLTFEEVARRDPAYLDWLITSTRGPHVQAASHALSSAGDVLLASQPPPPPPKRAPKPSRRARRKARRR